MNSFTFDFKEAHDDQAVLDFIKFAGFGDQSAVTFANKGVDCDHAQKMPLSLNEDFILNYSVKQRYSNFMYLFENEQLDDLPTLARNGTSSSTSSSVFDLWFARLEPSTFEQKNKNALKAVYDQMIAMDNSFPPFICLCNLLENSRGIILAHLIHEADQVLGNYLQANSRGLLMTAFQRAFRIFDAKHAINSMSSMISWKSHPSYARVKEQCTIQMFLRV